MQKRTPSMIHNGTSFVIVIFIVLCLAVFAALSLVLARSGYQMSRQTADRSLAVQEAYNQGDVWLKEIDDLLLAQYNELEKKDEAHFLAAVKTDPVLSELRHTIPLSDSQQLSIELEPCFPSKEWDGFYRITRWAIENTGTWEADRTIPVFQ